MAKRFQADLLEDDSDVSFAVSSQADPDAALTLQHRRFRGRELHHRARLVLTHVDERVLRRLVVVLFLLYQGLPHLQSQWKCISRLNQHLKQVLI